MLSIRYGGFDMKKVMTALLCVISILLSCAYAFHQKVVDNENLVHFNTNEHSINLHIQSSDLDKSYLFNEFNHLKDKYHLTFIRTDYFIEDGEEIVQKSGIFTTNYFQNSTINLISGNYPTNENEFIASFQTSNNNQVGTIHDLFEDQKLIILPMRHILSNNRLTANGEYTIEFENLDDIPAVKKELSQITGIDESSLFDDTYGSATITGTSYFIIIILILAIAAIFALTNIFYPITKLKEIGVMKLLGYSNYKIWYELNASMFIITILFTIVTIALQAFIIPQVNIQYFLQLCVYQLLIIVLGFLISCIMLIIIKKLKISQILKKCFNFKISLYSSYILKFLVFVGLIFAIPYMVKEVTRYIDERNMESIYKEQEDYITLAKFDFINNELNGFFGSGEDILGAKLIAMFRELEHSADAEYVSTFEIQPNAEENQAAYQHLGPWKEDQYIFSVVNQNYLKRIDYPFEKPLTQYFSENLTVLIPMKYKSDNIEELVKKQIIPIYFYDYIDQKEEWDKLPISIEYYKDTNKKIFSESLDRAGIDKGYISDPIFICQDTKYITTKNSLISNTAITNPIRIYDSSKNRDAIHTAIINHHLENNNLEFTNMLNSGFAQQIAISKSSSFIWFGIISLALFVSILSSYYISMIILVSKKQTMLVSRLLGHSFFERYKHEIYYFISLYTFSLLELLLLSKSLIAILFYIIVVLIDILVLYYLVKRQDTTSLSTALKGEE